MSKNIVEPREWKKIALLVSFMMGLAHVRRKEMRKRWLTKTIENENEGYIFDHPAVTYLTENLACFGLAFLIEKTLPVVDKKRLGRSFLIILLRGILMVDPLLCYEKFMAAFTFSHVPYFAAKKPPQDLKTLVTEYIRCNGVVMFVNTLIQFGILIGLPDEKVKNMIQDPPPLKLFPFMAKYMFCRVVVDIVFGVAHRIMHENAWAYENIHKQHHEHTTPRTQTNFHFTWVDQFIEAVLPMYASFSFLQLVGGGFPTRLEQTFIGIPILFFESASHTGKEAPIVTWIPFASPLIDMITGCDQRLIEYHTRHHQLYRCNYSISPWFDKLFGTYRIDLPDSYNKEGSYE